MHFNLYIFLMRVPSCPLQTRRPPEQPALSGLRGADGDSEEQRQRLLPCRAEDHAGHHGAPAAGPSDGGELTGRSWESSHLILSTHRKIRVMC